MIGFRMAVTKRTGAMAVGLAGVLAAGTALAANVHFDDGKPESQDEGIIVPVPIPAGNGKSNPGVLPPNSMPHGKSYGEWGELFVEWLVHFSPGEGPFHPPEMDDSNCGEGQTGQVWFIPGGADGVHTGCVIPPGKTLFVSVQTFVSFAPVFGGNEEEVRNDAETDFSLIATESISVDGVLVDSHEASSPPGGFTLPILPGTVLDGYTGCGVEAPVQPGDYAPAVVHGYFAMLPPLSAGFHTIHVTASGQDQCGDPYSYDITHVIQVAPNQ